MREEDEFSIGCCRRRTWESGSPCTELSKTRPEEGAPASAERTIAPLKVRHAGRLRARIAACAVIPFLLFLVMLVVPASSSAAVAIGVSVSFGPPALPVYVQPPCPGPGYIWTPGYWAWDPAYGYYWVPGTWVAAPFVGALWTPGYWGFGGGLYYWHPGYWGTLVGYYGGIDYGFGYPGFGYRGGYWNHDRFFYNRAVNNIRTTNITNVYYQNIRNVRGTRISYNGGPGGINARPTPAQLAAARYRRFGPVGQQMEQERFARANPVQRATMNRGRPAIAATPRPGMFRGNQVVRASSAGAPYREPPRTAFRGGRTQYSAPARVERAPAVNAPRYSSPRGRVERPAPQQNRPQPPAYRREAPSSYRPAPNRGRPPEARQFARRAAPERPAQPSRPERGGGGNHGRGPHR